MRSDSKNNFGISDDFLIASACKVKSDYFKDLLSGMDNVFHVRNFDALKKVIVQLEPETLLLDQDLPSLNGVRGISELRKLCPGTNIVVFDDSASDEAEWAMFKAGVRGCCPADIQLPSFKQMITSVNNGELWIRRKVLRRLLEQLAETQCWEPAKSMEGRSAIRHLLDQLTPREYEIAVKVGSGESNKQIAYSLAITERTVKAHLTNVFHKLGVADRLNVALIMSAKQCRKPSVSLVNTGPNHAHMATHVV
jgi:DNA-binding NarL/FixJ family response regulator